MYNYHDVPLEAWTRIYINFLTTRQKLVLALDLSVFQIICGCHVASFLNRMYDGDFQEKWSRRLVHLCIQTSQTSTKVWMLVVVVVDPQSGGFEYRSLLLCA